MLIAIRDMQEKGKRLGHYCKTNFSFEKMAEKLD
jgi:hypothetical protein